MNTLNDFIQFWMTSIVQFECKPSTQVMYDGVCRKYIQGGIGQKPLTNLCPADGLSFRMELCTMDLGASTINKIIICLKTILNKCVELGHLDRNPVSSLKPVKVQPTKYQVWTHDQISHFKGSNSPSKPVYFIALCTGMRLGEIAGLRHSDVLREEKMLCVDQNRSRYGLGTPKSNKGRRVPITGFLWGVLEPLLKANSDDLIFDIDTANFSKVFERDCKDIGVPYIKFHNLRHTFATNYITAGGDLFKLSKILGHSSVTITEKTYVHLLAKTLCDEIHTLDIGV